MGYLPDVIREPKSRQATLHTTEHPIDAPTPAGTAFLDILGVCAEFGTNVRHKRRMERIAKAIGRGVYEGRKAALDPDRIPRPIVDGIHPSGVARHLGISLTSLRRQTRSGAVNNKSGNR